MGVRGALPAFAAGLIAASYQLPPSLPLLLPLLALGAAIGWLVLQGRFVRLAPFAWLAFFALAGMSLYHLRIEPPLNPSHIVHFAGPETHRLEGRVLDLSRRPDDTYIADLEISRIFKEDKALAVHGRLRLHLGAGEALFRSGHTVRFRTRLRPPRLFGTPGEFDYVRYLAARDIFVTGYIDSPASVVPIIPAEERVSSFQANWQRERIGELIDTKLDDSAAPLVRALVIGDKKVFDPATRDILSRAGLSHLFSVSGLHLGTAAGFLYLLLLFLYRRSERLLLWQPPKRVLPLFLLIPLWGYVLLTGAALPTQRAFIFFAVGAILLFTSRSVRPWRILEAAALGLLAVEPLALFEPAFQLSFAGVAGIMGVLSRKNAKAEKGGIRRFFVGVFLTTTVATLATLPLVLWHFHLLAPAGLVANLFAVPLVAFVALPLGLTGLMLSFAWPAAAQFLFLLCGGILRGCLDLAEALTRWPVMRGWELYAAPWEALGVALVVVACLLWFAVRRRRGPAVALAAGGALLLTGAISPSLGPAVTFFSVGQGDSSLLSLSDDRHLLVDGGGLYGDRFDVGERLLLPALAKLGVHELEAVILTHDHPDHRKGLLAVLRSLDVKEFLTEEEPEHLDRDLRRVIAEAGVPIRTLPPGWHEFSGSAEAVEEVRLFVPLRSFPDENDQSIVIYHRYGSQGTLLTGDIEAAGVRHFVDQAPVLGVTHMKLPHHGSRYSQSELLLDTFRPEIVTVSAGYENPYHLPAKQMIEEVERRDIPVYRTDLDGTVMIDLEPDVSHVKHWKRGLFR
ncbi:MAG: DNA internalization-related competence protein ComEC/Rec2 [Desulfuromonadales bacterium]